MNRPSVWDHASAPARVMVVALPLSAWGLARLIETEPVRMHCVGMVSSAAEGVLQVRQLRPDVVVYDLDGEDDTEALADLHAQTEAKVLAVTSSPHTAVHDNAVLAGARGVVAKREGPEVLLRAIDKVRFGEIWIDRGATGRIFQELARQRAGRREDPEKTLLAQLTPRERQTVAALAADAAAPGKVLAKRMHISENTLRNHLTSIYSKLQVANRVELYAFAHRHGLAAEA
ncbi:response regulator transcription factor [Aquabacterium sp. A08]|uniref:LuxR C-terminal-related transcriptional regulator n=1 Tax=Aquabacterium sp. A08 TaxID=2718532 RepID=UPI0014200AD2|nr:response regulator transcription factor [Aquabacterium sp. A08]NIC41787.1 response regulator transcription factor [Aquabacterium sp. A08]